jgi:hypothetical protein
LSPAGNFGFTLISAQAILCLSRYTPSTSLSDYHDNLLPDFREAEHYWVIESRLNHAPDVTLGEYHSRVRNPKATFALSLFRRVVVSFAELQQKWLTSSLEPR